MRITDIRETSVALNSTLKNSSIDFSEMTTSVVAVITDVVRDGKPVTGFAFNSTGRYACGAQMRARFIPRLLKAEPTSLLDDAGTSRSARMRRRDDAQRKVRRTLASARSASARSKWRSGTRWPRSPASRCMCCSPKRHGGDPAKDEMLRLCGRRLVRAGQGHPGIVRRDEASSRCRLHHGEDEGRRRAACRRHAPHRGGEAHPAGPRRACGRCQLQIRPDRSARLREGDGAVRAALVRGAVRSARLCDAGRNLRRLSACALDWREPVLARRTWKTSCASATSSPRGAT